jgi:hypothetical protein
MAGAYAFMALGGPRINVLRARHGGALGGATAQQMQDQVADPLEKTHPGSGMVRERSRHLTSGRGQDMFGFPGFPPSKVLPEVFSIKYANECRMIYLLPPGVQGLR